jgi:hypothetical protein
MTSNLRKDSPEIFRYISYYRLTVKVPKNIYVMIENVEVHFSTEKNEQMEPLMTSL